MIAHAPVQTPVTGDEYKGNQRDKLQALAQFYCALNFRDLALMQQNWANSHSMRLAIRTSRIFRKDADGTWRQVHHHGSIDDPQMLAAYQATILGKRLVA